MGVQTQKIVTLASGGEEIGSHVIPEGAVASSTPHVHSSENACGNNNHSLSYKSIISHRTPSRSITVGQSSAADCPTSLNLAEKSMSILLDAMANHTQFDESSSGNTTNDASKPTFKPLEFNHAITYGAEETGEAGDGVTTQMVSSHLRQSLADSKTEAQSSAYKISGKIKVSSVQDESPGLQETSPFLSQSKNQSFQTGAKAVIVDASNQGEKNYEAKIGLIKLSAPKIQIQSEELPKNFAHISCDEPECSKNKLHKHNVFTNNAFYCFFRLLHILYTRFNTLRLYSLETDLSNTNIQNKQQQQQQQNSKSSQNSISPPSGPGQMSKDNNFERQNGKQVESHEWDVYPAYSMEFYLAGIHYSLATALKSTVHNYHDHYIQNNVFWENNHWLLPQDENLGACSRIGSTSSGVAESHPSEHQKFGLLSLPTQLEATSGLNGEVKSSNEIHAAVSLYNLVRTDSSSAAESLVSEHKNSEQTSLSAIQPLKNFIKAGATAGFVESSYNTFENDFKFTQQRETNELDGEGHSFNEIYENIYLLKFNCNPNSLNKNSTRKKKKPD
ncbi:hypothetical protein BY996DRAFT_6408261 [Phakopsora pachyrhizi]|nr:hypothetical protein BY996DRAFT_6408261 [Phakopsora pachyrhizi]